MGDDRDVSQGDADETVVCVKDDLFAGDADQFTLVGVGHGMDGDVGRCGVLVGGGEVSRLRH